MFRDLVEHSPEIIQSVDSEGRYLYVNESWRSILGYTSEDAESMNVVDVVAPEHRESCMARLRRVFQGETLRDVETIFVDRDGRRIDVVGSISCRIVDGKPVATRAIFRPAAQAEGESTGETIHATPVVCSWCGAMRQSDGGWTRSDRHLGSRASGRVSHGLCDECAGKALSDLERGR